MPGMGTPVPRLSRAACGAGLPELGRRGACDAPRPRRPQGQQVDCVAPRLHADRRGRVAQGRRHIDLSPEYEPLAWAPSGKACTLQLHDLEGSSPMRAQPPRRVQDPRAARVVEPLPETLRAHPKLVLLEG